MRLLKDPQFQKALERLTAEKLAPFVRQNELRAKELALMERVIRVEEGLKALWEVEQARFEAMGKRSESLAREMNARFEAMEKRLAALQRGMGIRFGAVDRASRRWKSASA